MDDVHAASLSVLATHDSDPQRSQALTTRLSNELIPRADADLATVQAIHSTDDAAEKQTIAELASRWYSVRALWFSMVLDPPLPAVGVAKIDGAFTELNRISRALVARETSDGHTEYVDSAQPYQTKRRDMLIVLSISLLAAMASVVWLYRGVLPRTRKYSAFAERLAEDDFAGRLDTRGGDELAVLGRTLDDMATRRRRERSYDQSQLAFAESMQLCENEAEAHRMLKRHLERSIDKSDVVVLNRNNSQNRLEPVTEIGADSLLTISLDHAVPRSCIAVRQARTYEGVEGEAALLQCSVCGDCSGRSTCTPLLVGGEVIGSVLVSHQQTLNEIEARRIRDSVVQAAPVLANLRNLGIAQTRAATDSLTGLPNRRAIDANLMRMVALAGRSMEPIAALLLDLDHFKQVNDRYGHGGGDELLAAVGAAIQATIRESDFAGRYGGEEFIVALPNTGLDGAVKVAELLRRAIGGISVPSVDQTITVSVGVAVLPDHAADAVGLVRAADRALYLAKNLGRDRVETARAPTTAAL
jgi:diguanylate cyclase (GGDEF)-like protein